MRPYETFATVAALQVVCFSVRADFQPQFFLLHLYQTIICVALLILLFCIEDRRACMIGMLTPIPWLGMAFVTDLLGGAARQVQRLTPGEGVTNAVSALLRNPGDLVLERDSSPAR